MNSMFLLDVAVGLFIHSKTYDKGEETAVLGGVGRVNESDWFRIHISVDKYYTANHLYLKHSLLFYGDS